jgi:hypothetical protein
MIVYKTIFCLVDNKFFNSYERPVLIGLKQLVHGIETEVGIISSTKAHNSVTIHILISYKFCGSNHLFILLFKPEQFV